ncbi:methyltransferase domain-containing protein [Candidatus Trichorickettsia mobilis]|uniref:methyltransferase domain-containing protein n=1 Tax=Candidatus Trichorickettsia mobilis TaxID=1346319 RepID=UPI00292F1118|nr:methyltransferase domain-containing protein [Candidatus Trichorickettsia mobilis]
MNDKITINKLSIQKNFNDNAKTYDSVASIQKKCAKLLVDLLIKNFPDFIPLTIADLGAGTGYVTEYLLKFYPDSRYFLNDFALAMLDITRDKFKNYSNIHYNSNDIETLNLDYQDLIISNFALQWTTNLELIIQNLRLRSRILVFSTLLSGTFKEWSDLYQDFGLPRPISDYPTQKELEDYCLSLKPENYLFRCEDFSMTFDSPLAFASYLKMLGANTNITGSENHYLREIIKNHHLPIKTNYKIFFAILEGR